MPTGGPGEPRPLAHTAIIAISATSAVLSDREAGAPPIHGLLCGWSRVSTKPSRLPKVSFGKPHR